MLKPLTMSDSHTIPIQGFGVYQIPADQTADAVAHAIEAGYRLSLIHISEPRDRTRSRMPSSA